jgi:hypothetical protein
MVFHDPKPCFEANVLHSTHYGADMTFHKACFHVSMFFHDTLFQMQWTIVTFTVFSKHCGNICNTVTVTTYSGYEVTKYHVHEGTSLSLHSSNAKWLFKAQSSSKQEQV